MGDPKAASQFTRILAVAFAYSEKARPRSMSAPLKPRVGPNDRIQKASSSSLITQILERFHGQ